MRLRWVIFWAASAVTIAMLITSVIHEVHRQKQMLVMIQEKTKALEQAQDRLSRMRDRIEFFKTEEGQAWIARDRLNMAFNGEEIYKIEGEVPTE